MLVEMININCAFIYNMPGIATGFTNTNLNTKH